VTSPRLKVLSVVGTRPNMMKIAPIAAVLRRDPEAFEHVLVHTGQHYDHELSAIFLEEFGLGEPQHMLGVGSASHSVQVARVMERLEPILREERPDIVLVPGDVNSTMAAALTAATMRIPVGHVEAGLRSFDPTMPEELNRIVADTVSDLLFIHSPEARDNLLAEGRPADAIHEVGNTMIDTLVAMRSRIEAFGAPERHRVERGRYIVATLHRAALFESGLLDAAIAALGVLAEAMPVVFPAHPRTRQAIEAAGLAVPPGLRMINPVGYVEFLSLVASSAAVLTDSGGVQDETTYLRIPCFTLRDNTERSVTVERGTNVLLGLAPERISEVPHLLRERSCAETFVPVGWDGCAAERIRDVIAAELATPDRDSRFTPV
jgi:UDP-N-acetylglucosamine 2-epimerase (non-hydrolysing)